MGNLTDITIKAAIKAAKTATKPIRCADGGGMYLEVKPGGSSALWRMQCRFNNDRRLLSFGSYPVVTLQMARERQAEVKRQLASNQDPSAAKREHKAAIRAANANDFEAVATAWFSKWKDTVSPATAQRQWARLTKYAFPRLRGVPIKEVSAPMILDVLQKVEDTGVMNTVQKTRTAISLVMTFAVFAGHIPHNPVPELAGMLKKYKTKHFAALTTPEEVGRLMYDIDNYRATSPEVKAALKLAPLLFVRIGELRHARWKDIDLDRAMWVRPPSKGKETPLLVPLARQAVAILRELHPVTGGGELVFPGQSGKSRPFSNATLNRALRSMGYGKEEITGHGFRATARTLIRQELRIPRDVVEMQLDHVSLDANGTAYDRAHLLDERIDMMSAWADYLDQLKAGAKVIPLRA